MNKLLLILLFVCVAISSLCIGSAVCQNFQTLYARSIMFEQPGTGSVNLVVGQTLRSGLQTVTIPDGTGTIDTSYNNFSFLMTSLKALDAAHGSHSGINWTSFGY